TRFCKANTTDCNRGTAWTTRNPNFTKYAPGDALPFLVRYSPVQTDPTGAALLLASNRNVWKSAAVACSATVTTDCCETGEAIPCWRKVGAFPASPTVSARNLFASQNIAKLYGIA